MGVRDYPPLGLADQASLIRVRKKYKNSEKTIKTENSKNKDKIT